MKLVVDQNPTEVLHEFTKLEIVSSELSQSFVVDLDFAAILALSWKPHTRALDFLVIAAVVYAVDKIVTRKTAADHWGRILDVTIPLCEPGAWSSAASQLSDSVSFLTGDSWTFTFTQAGKSFQARRANRRKHSKGFPASPVVTLLSGGLDSLIGALDLFDKYRTERLLFVSHYDRHMSGPATDQENLRRILDAKFGRSSHMQVRVGAIPAVETRVKCNFETSFRSRSLIFLGLAVYAASKIGPEVPILIPENGPIALNMPLNPSRRGACSTRTVHPFFLESLTLALKTAGIANPIRNPYAFKTKGEMVKECRFPEILKEAIWFTNSCGKANRKTHWKNRNVKACGTCVPCLFRRASLHTIGSDTEVFGNDVFKAAPAKYPDFHALLGLIRKNPTERQIAKSLLANGRLELGDLKEYSALVRRMISEVSIWLSEKASDEALALAQLQRVSV